MATAAGGLMGWSAVVRAADTKPLVVHNATIIRVRDRHKGGPSDSYLELTSESGRKGYAGPLLKEQVTAFPANLRELLAGRDAADPEQLNFGTKWAACHPGKCRWFRTGTTCWRLRPAWHRKARRSVRCWST